MQIANDTPKELITLLKKIDFSKLTKTEIANKLDQLDAVINSYRQFIPLRTGRFTGIEIVIPGCPDRLADIANKNDWARINFLHKTIAMPFIKKWFFNNLPLKK